jgi:S1-C subfamily serine protease
MNYRGQVVGIATAIVEESQGIGFAIPSDSILLDIQRLIT